MQKPSNRMVKGLRRLITVPENSDMEQALLGCVLLDKNDGGVLPELISNHSCVKDYFHDVRCKVVFENILRLFDKNKKVEEMFLINSIKKHEGLDEAGGVHFIIALMDKTPSALNWKSYAKELKDYYIKRKLIGISNDVIALVGTEPEAESALDIAQKRILAVAQEHSQSGEKDTTVLVQDYLDQLTYLSQNQNAMIGISTGYNNLDNVLCGLKPAEILILAARPSVGKTSFALCIAKNVAVNQGRPVGIFSLEMSAAALVQRLIHVQAGIGKDNAVNHVTAISSAASLIANAPFHIDDRSGLTVQQITAAARRMYHQHKRELLVIDYLQLIRATRDRGSRNDEVTEISNGCKSLAKELNIPIILLSQLSRSSVQENRRPRLSDLRDSGSIEQDADQVVFLYKPLDVAVNDDDKVLPINLSVDKNRDGISGVTIDLTFQRSLTRFVEAKVITTDEET